MSWTAFDGGAALARNAACLPTCRLAAARDAVTEQVMERGWSGTEPGLTPALRLRRWTPRSADAAGEFLATDPAWLSTLDPSRRLVSDSLVYRYDPAASPDGLGGPEAPSAICTFLHVDALTRAGRLEQARFAFEKMLTYANHVGLFAEEIGPSGEQLGNFPQAFTHLSLIMAATTLDEALDLKGV